jgi:shikimate kinase
MTPDIELCPGGPRGPGLTLIGYRGAGKSTVGRIVAERSNRMFLDTDREIEARAGRSIRAIFAEWGEGDFRDREEQTLAHLTAAFPGAIVAAGGGAVLRKANRRRIRDFGFVVWLTAHPAELARRLVCDPGSPAERPPLTAAGTVAEIAQVLAVRAPIYQALADTAIETGEKSPDETALTIIDHWARWP